MLKIRIIGSTKEIKWLLKIMEKNSKYVASDHSKYYESKNSKRNKLMYLNLYKPDEFKKHEEERLTRTTSKYCGSGRVFLSDGK